MYDIIILGAGGFGREILSWVPRCFPADDYRVKGYLDQDSGRLERFGVPVPVLAAPGDYQVQSEDRFLVAVGDPAGKERVVEPILAQGGRFLTMVHRLAVLNDFTHLNFYASVGHDVEIGAFSTLSPYATVNGMCTIGRSVFMGTHTSVAVGATVGDRTKISSNACVMKSVGADQFVFGVPGKAVAQFRG
jgi:hypothetical protein